MKKDELKDWALRHGFKQSTRSSKIFKKVIRTEVCKDGVEREIFYRLVFNDRKIRAEVNYYVITNFFGKTSVENHWLLLRSGFYSKMSINPVNDKLKGMK